MKRVLIAALGAAALGTVWAPVHAQVAPLPNATDPPPAGPAYVLSAPDDPTWLTLVTRSGRWVIRCEPAAILPATNVLVHLDGPNVELAPMLLAPNGQPVPDLTHACMIQQALFVGAVPCAELDGVCDVAAESEGPQPDIGPSITLEPAP